MALGQLRLRDWWRVVRRELTAGVALGAMLALIGSCGSSSGRQLSSLRRASPGDRSDGRGEPARRRHFGTLAGAMLPLLLQRARLDPASASAPLVATLVDVTGIAIYFSVASLILAGRLL
jgi:magnesium transporter